MEAREGARLSPGTFPVPPHALLPTHISLQKKSLDFVWLDTYGHHCTVGEELFTAVQSCVMAPENRNGAYVTRGALMMAI